MSFASLNRRKQSSDLRIVKKKMWKLSTIDNSSPPGGKIPKKDGSVDKDPCISADKSNLDGTQYLQLMDLAKLSKETLREIMKDPHSDNAVKAEQQLWSFVLKYYKKHTASTIDYLLGVYIIFNEYLFAEFSQKGSSLKLKHRLRDFSGHMNQHLVYNLHIRMGDLHRYAGSRENAKFFYEEALLIDSRRGTAFNQLVLCTPLTKAYKCVYFSIRAYKAPIDAIKFADTNIKMAISRIDNPLFENFRKSLKVQLEKNAIKIASPTSGLDWLYLSVISVYFNDFNQTFPALLDYIITLIDNQKTDNANLDYCLMALEVALDWIMKDRKNVQNEFYQKTMKCLASEFKTALNVSDEGNGIKMSLISRDIALKHNFILREFVPLQGIYEKMHFYGELQDYSIQRDRKILTCRLVDKLENF